MLPLRAADVPPGDFFNYVNRLSASVEVILVDASAGPVFQAVGQRCVAAIRHLRPDEDLAPLSNGKVRGVLTGLRRASCDRVVIADDDVRYTPATLDSVERALESADVVRPQNYFTALPWHARLDTARMLINRTTGGDWPGTLAVRRASLEATGGYDGNVLFENLELVRTIRMSGGVESCALDLFVARHPPTTRHFFTQRIRQAYDEFARPHRLAVALAALPALSVLVAARRLGTAVAIFGAAPVAIAAAGRHRSGGTRVFPASTVLWAPLWVLERAVCAWLAVAARVAFGGVRYAGRTLRVAANSESAIAKRLLASSSSDV